MRTFAVFVSLQLGAVAQPVNNTKDAWSGSWAASAANGSRSQAGASSHMLLRIAPQTSSGKHAAGGVGEVVAQKLSKHISIHVPLEHAATVTHGPALQANIHDPALQVAAFGDSSAQRVENATGEAKDIHVRSRAEQLAEKLAEQLAEQLKLMKHGAIHVPLERAAAVTHDPALQVGVDDIDVWRRQAETKTGSDIHVALGTVDPSRAEQLAKQLAEQLTSPGVSRSSAEQLAERLAEQLMSPSVVRSHAERLADQLAEQLADQMKEHRHVVDTSGATRRDTTLRASVASPSRAEQLAEHFAEQVKRHKRVFDTLTATRGNATLAASVAAPPTSPSRAEQLAEHFAEQVLAASVAAPPTSPSRAEQLAEHFAEQVKAHKHVGADPPVRFVAPPFIKTSQKNAGHVSTRDSKVGVDPPVHETRAEVRRTGHVSTREPKVRVDLPVRETRAEVRRTPTEAIQPAPQARTDVRPRTPETVRRVEHAGASHVANVTLGTPARLAKRGARKHHAQNKAKRGLQTKTAAPAFARAPDVPASEDFLNTLDASTVKWPVRRLLAAKREFDAKARRAAVRISRVKSRVANIRHNVGALAAAVAQADSSSSL